MVGVAKTEVLLFPIAFFFFPSCHCCYFWLTWPLGEIDTTNLERIYCFSSRDGLKLFFCPSLEDFFPFFQQLDYQNAPSRRFLLFHLQKQCAVLPSFNNQFFTVSRKTRKKSNKQTNTGERMILGTISK